MVGVLGSNPSVDTIPSKAPVAELVDALDLGSSISRCAGSSPVRRTEISKNHVDFLHPSYLLLYYLASLAFAESVSDYFSVGNKVFLREKQSVSWAETKTGDRPHG